MWFVHLLKIRSIDLGVTKCQTEPTDKAHVSLYFRLGIESFECNIILEPHVYLMVIASVLKWFQLTRTFPIVLFYKQFVYVYHKPFFQSYYYSNFKNALSLASEQRLTIIKYCFTKAYNL